MAAPPLLAGDGAGVPSAAERVLHQLLPHSLSSLHILVVDDERLTRLVVANLLRKCSYQVTVVDSGREAIEALRDEGANYQLILTDVMMPDVDGLALLRFVRSSERLRNIPVIMMSANEHSDTVYECIRGGAEDYLVKPVTKKEVQHIWQHVWRRRAAPPQRVPVLRPPEDEAGPSGAAAGGAGAADTSAAAAAAQADDELVVAPLPSLPSPPPPPPAVETVVAPAVVVVAAAAAELPGVAPAAPSRQLSAPPPLLAAAAAGAPLVAGVPPAGGPLSLRAWLDRPARAADTLEALHIFHQAAAAVAAAHAAAAPRSVARPGRLRLSADGAVTAADADADAQAAQTAADAADEAAYRAPEGGPGGAGDPAGDVYALGVLLFELLHAQRPGSERDAALTDLRRRILPPALLRGCPAEAGLVLWLLHPSAAGRPGVRDALRAAPLAVGALAARAAAAELATRRREAGAMRNFLDEVRRRRSAAAAALGNELAELEQALAATEGALAARRAAAAAAEPPPQDAALMQMTTRVEHCGEDAPHAKRRRLEVDERDEASGAVAPPPPLLPAAAGEAAAREARQRAAAAAAVARLPSGAADALLLSLHAALAADDTSPPPAPPPLRPSPVAVSELGARLGSFCGALARATRVAGLVPMATLHYGALALATSPATSAGGAAAAAFSRDGALCAVTDAAASRGVVAVYDAAAADADCCDGDDADGSDVVYARCAVALLTPRGAATGVAWSPCCGAQVAASHAAGGVGVWDVAAGGTLLRDVALRDGGAGGPLPRCVATHFSPADGRCLAAAAADGTLLLWSLPAPAPAAAALAPAPLRCIRFAPDGRTLAAGCADGRVLLYDTRRLDGPTAVIAAHRKALLHVRFVDGRTLCSAAADGTVKLWDLAGAGGGAADMACGVCDAPAATLSGHGGEGPPVGLALWRRGGYVAVGGSDCTVALYHATTSAPALRAPLPGADAATGAPAPPPRGAYAAALAWRPDGGALLAATSAGVVRLMRVVQR